MNGLLPHFFIQRLPGARREVLGQFKADGIEFPESYIQSPERRKEASGNRCDARRQNEQSTISKKAVAGGLHETLSPIADLGFNGCDLNRRFDRKSGEVRTCPMPPRDEHEVGPPESFQSEFASCRQTCAVGGDRPDFLLHPNLLESAQEVRLASFARRCGRQVAPGIMRPESDFFYWRGAGHLLRNSEKYGIPNERARFFGSGFVGTGSHKGNGSTIGFILIATLATE